MSIKKYDEFCELVAAYGLDGKQVTELIAGYMGNRIFDKGLLEYAHEQYKDFIRVIDKEEMASICDVDGNIMAAMVQYNDGTSKICLSKDEPFYKNKNAIQTSFFKIKLQRHDDLSFDENDRLWISRDDQDNLLDEFKFINDKGDTKLVSGNSCYFKYEMQETIHY